MKTADLKKLLLDTNLLLPIEQQFPELSDIATINAIKCHVPGNVSIEDEYETLAVKYVKLMTRFDLHKASALPPPLDDELP